MTAGFVNTSYTSIIKFFSVLNSLLYKIVYRKIFKRAPKLAAILIGLAKLLRGIIFLKLIPNFLSIFSQYEIAAYSIALIILYDEDDF